MLLGVPQKSEITFSRLTRERLRWVIFSLKRHLAKQAGKIDVQLDQSLPEK